MSMHGWITVHDGSMSKRQRPREMRVRASSIDTIRPYRDGVVRAVLAVHGTYLHVEETEEDIERMILDAERLLE